MQSLDVISINLWQILISLCNLLLLFLIIKKFLYKPVKRLLQERQSTLDQQYAAADNAKKQAEQSRVSWEEKLQGAQAEADTLLKEETARAERRSAQIVSEAREKADIIVHEAEKQADLEHKKAQAEIKKEIVDVSALLTEKMLRREIRQEDHRDLIDAVISEIGETYDGNQ